MYKQQIQCSNNTFIQIHKYTNIYNICKIRNNIHTQAQTCKICKQKYEIIKKCKLIEMQTSLVGNLIDCFLPINNWHELATKRFVNWMSCQLIGN